MFLRHFGPVLQIRTGVHTGEVIVGDATGATLASGDAVNVAARLEQAAAPGEILVSRETHRLVSGPPSTEEAGDRRSQGQARAGPRLPAAGGRSRGAGWPR